MRRADRQSPPQMSPHESSALHATTLPTSSANRLRVRQPQRVWVLLALALVVAWPIGCAESRAPGDSSLDAGDFDASGDASTAPVDMGMEPPADAGVDLGVDAYVPPLPVIVSGLSGALSEPSSMATFTVRLGSAPTSNVALSLSASDPTEGSVGVTSLVFTPSNWDQPQTVELTAANDDLVDGVVPWAVVLGALSSNDPVFAGHDPADVSVATSDDDAADIVVSSPTGVLCDAAGMSASFTVVLTAEPSGSVTIPVSTTSGAVSVLPASLVFTADDWDMPRTITLTSNGSDVSVDTPVPVHLGAPSSSDPWFAALSVRDVDASLCDLAGRSIVVRAVGGGDLANPLITREDGATASFEVSLGAAPDADVVLALSATDTDEVTISPTSLTFTTSNWSTPQVVTLTGLNDSVADGAPDFDVYVAVSASTDAVYAALLPVAIPVKNFPSKHDVTGMARASYVNCPSNVTCNNANLQYILGLGGFSVPIYASPSYILIDLHQDVLNPTILLGCNSSSSMTIGRRSSAESEYTTSVVAASSSTPINGIVRYITLSTPVNASCLFIYVEGYGDG